MQLIQKAKSWLIEARNNILAVIVALVLVLFLGKVLHMKGVKSKAANYYLVASFLFKGAILIMGFLALYRLYTNMPEGPPTLFSNMK